MGYRSRRGVSIMVLKATVALTLIGAALGCGSGPREEETSGGGRRPTTIVLTSFVTEEAGGFGGETGPFLQVLEGGVEITHHLPFCRRAWEGTIHQQPVTAVAAGSGKVEVGLCMADLLRHYQGRRGIKDVVWSGIAGATPAVGGLLRQKSPRERVAIGDVCVSYFALDWDRQYQSLAQEVRWWSRPAKPNYQAVGDPELARELYQAAEAVAWPQMPLGPAQTMEAYHGTGSARSARVFHWERCGEVTADMFWHGEEEDERARALLASLISQVQGGEQKSPGDVVAFSACNNTAWMNALEAWAERTGESIPFAFTRAVSNYTHPPLDATGQPSKDAMESIQWSMTEGDGGGYASITAALPVLKMLELRGNPRS
jgi:hypothetical protein